MTRWPGSNGHRRPVASRWPERRRLVSPVEPPAWWRTFDPAEWARPGDDEVRHPAGALVGPVEVARRRWRDAQQRWAEDNGMSIVDYLIAQRQARLGRLPGGGRGGRRRRVRSDDDDG